jgi:hypothetical protein
MSTPPTTITIAIVRFTGDVQEKENVDDDICALTSTNYDILLLNHHDGVQMPTCSVREYTQETARRRALQVANWVLKSIFIKNNRRRLSDVSIINRRLPHARRTRHTSA